MEPPPPPAPERIAYQRGRFQTRLPADRRYTAAHFWLLEISPGLWRVGFTRFATRMLGDLVEYEFEVPDGAPVKLGQVIGWVEAFKATSDLYSPVEGVFAGGNPDLATNIEAPTKDPYGTGWLYMVKGTPDPASTDVHGYIATLDATIDRLQGHRPATP